MKRITTLFALVLCMALAANARTTFRGDLNGDGTVNVSDITSLINHVLDNQTQDIDTYIADLNGHGVINVSDVTSLINLVLEGREVLTKQEYVWNYHAVPEIHLSISLDEWNPLLRAYNADQKHARIHQGTLHLSHGGATAP